MKSSRIVISQQQKVAIVTGASQGIGAALVKALRERGHAVVATSRSIGASGDPGVVTVAGDIGCPETAERVVAEAIQRFGRIDLLVNNAGIFIAKPFTQYTAEDFAQKIATNVAGFFYMTQAAVRAMQRNGTGHVVSITTSLVDHALSVVPAVLASLTKGALNAASRSLAVEYAARGIRFNTVAPGIVNTPMHPAAMHARLAALHPMGRMGEISDIVDAVLYLDSAKFVTGEVLHVDGGQSAGH